MGKDITKTVVEQDIEWEQTTVSGKIFSRLRAAALSQGTTFSIANKDGMMERFRFGNEEAYLLKSLQGGTTGGRDGVLVTKAEGWQYKRMRWWKEAIDKAGVKLEFLDPPFLWVAKDAGVENYASIFSPAGIVNRFAPDITDEAVKKQLMESAESLLFGVLQSQLQISDYGVIDLDGGLRAVALNQNAVQGRTQDNPTYQALVSRVRQIAPSLPAAYAKLT